MKRPLASFVFRSLMFATFAVALQLPGCGARPDPEQLKAKLDELLPPPGEKTVARSSQQVQAGRLHVYFDASRSVRGFVPQSHSGGIQTDFTRFISSLRTWASTNYPSTPTGGVELFRFGERVVPIADWNVPRFRRFYTDSRTEIVDVLRRITRAQQGPEVVLIITDGVPVTPDHPHDWAAMVDEIANWTAAGNVFQILMCRGEFNDYVVSIQLGEQLSTPYSSAKHGKRPFYCWVFARSSETGRRLKEYLRVDGHDVKFLDLTGRILAACRISLSVPDTVPAAGQTKLNPLMFDAQDGKFWFFRWRRSNLSSGRIAVNMDVDPEHECEDIRVSCAGMTNATSALRVIEASPQELQCERVNRQPTAVYRSVSPVTGSGRVSFHLDVPRPDDNNWYAYRLDFYSGHGTFMPPQWVSDVSTESDTRPEDWKKTIYFDRFVNSILAKTRVLGSVYIAIGR